MTPEEVAIDLCEEMAVDWSLDFRRPSMRPNPNSAHEAWIQRIAAAIKAENEGCAVEIEGSGDLDYLDIIRERLVTRIRARVKS